MEKLRLCYLATGKSVHSYRWIKFFAERNHDIFWLSLDPMRFFPLENIKFQKLSLSFKILDIIGGSLYLKKILRSFKPDILHAHYAGKYGLVGALSGFHPYILTAWGSDVLFASKRFFTSSLVKYALKKADLITCDALHMKKAIKNLGISEDKIFTIYFGTDTQKFHPKNRNSDFWKKMGIYSSKVVISLRSFEPIYDIETLIKAVPVIVKQIPDVKFVIAGEGSQKRYLMKLVQELEVSEKINFIGFIPPQALPVYLASSDVYVSTSLSDAGLAASTAEAMASGVPVVVTDSGENHLWIENGRNGFLVPVQDVKALAEKISLLLKFPSLRKELGESARRTICERNDYYKEMKKMEDIYYQIKS